MSSTWVAEFDNEKDYNHFVARFNEIAPKGGNIIVPEMLGNPDRVRERGAWVDLDDDVYVFCKDFDEDVHGDPPLKDPAWAVSFDIAIWDDWTKSFITAIMQEMCHRYSFVEIGCTSTELISQDEFLKWRIMSTERFNLMAWNEEYEKNPKDILAAGVTRDGLDRAEKEIETIEDAFRAAAKRFFDGDASDLILTFKEEEV
jgi:hypothetical protein